MRSHRDKNEQDLFAELARLRARMQEIHENGGCKDPDKMMAELESEARSINQMTEDIIKELETVNPTQSDLNALTDGAAKWLVTSVSFPVVVHTTLDPRLLGVMLSPELLRSIVQRAMLITAEHEGPGGELTVKTSKERGKAVLSITATNIATGLESCVPIEMRCASLVQLVEEAGGEVELLEGQGRLRLTIRLAHAVPTK
jgi:hypothetical protein